MGMNEADMNIKCIALDLDGTTLRDANTLSDANRDALLRALDRGVEIVVASGRPMHSLPASVIGIDGINYAITSNGSEVYDLRNGDCLRRAILEKSVVELIMKECGDYDVAMEVFIDGQAFCSQALYDDPPAFGIKPEYTHYITSTRNPQADIYAFLKEHVGEYGNIDFVVKDPAVGREIRSRFVKYSEKVYVTSSIDSRVEFGSVDSGKNNGLLFLMDRFGFERSQVAAFGNADNDVEMLHCAGVGIAVADSSENCLAAADFVTKACRDDGVAWAIENILKL